MSAYFALTLRGNWNFAVRREIDGRNLLLASLEKWVFLTLMLYFRNLAEALRQLLAVKPRLHHVHNIVSHCVEHQIAHRVQLQLAHDVRAMSFGSLYA
jgi:hypothetical protein